MRNKYVKRRSHSALAGDQGDEGLGAKGLEDET